MTEKELRQRVVDTALSYIGCKEADGTHRKIIDIYNTQSELPRGYRMRYTDAWCATYVSAMAILCGITDIIPTECGCENMIKKFAAIGRWMEDDSYRPNIGDIIFYDWDDCTGSAADNVGYSDHVGIVCNVVGNEITVVEGNISDAVGKRRIAVNGKYIRGYGIPDYASKCESDAVPAQKETVEYNGEYIVQEGDNLWTIARNVYGYFTTFGVETIKRLNGITGDLIKVGDRLKVPVIKTTDGSIEDESETVSVVLPLLKMGDNSMAVRGLQALLNMHGVTDYINGSFDDRTKNDVIRFQIAAGIEADGIVGEHTWEALFK